MEYSISKTLSKYQRYPFYAVVVMWAFVSILYVALYAVGYPDYKPGIILGLIGAGMFSFWKATEYEHDRFIYLLLTVGYLFIYFQLDLLLITPLALVFAILYYYHLAKDIRVWLSKNKITW